MHYPDLSPSHAQTPFADFIDRVLAVPSEPAPGFLYPSLLEEPIQHPPSVHKDALPAAQQTVTPTATAGYKRLSGPLSEWMTNFVWKACTTDLTLPSGFSRLS